MNFELTVAESFDSSWSLLQSLHINFLTSNSCERPHRLLDLIVKERDSLSCRGMRILRFPDSESSTFYCLAPGRFGPTNTAAAFSQGVSALPCQRGGIIGSSNVRASRTDEISGYFSEPEVNNITLIANPQSYPQVASFVPKTTRGHPTGIPSFRIKNVIFPAAIEIN